MKCKFGILLLWQDNKKLRKLLANSAINLQASFGSKILLRFIIFQPPSPQFNKNWTAQNEGFCPGTGLYSIQTIVQCETKHKRILESKESFLGIVCLLVEVLKKNTVLFTETSQFPYLQLPIFNCWEPCHV